jgi:RimJ/RimL family protein N-acetyltransferase/GNAT superfamily N-acetyltransferase
MRHSDPQHTRCRRPAAPENRSLLATGRCSLVAMRIVAWDPADPAALAACHEAQRAAQLEDDPFGPPKSARVLRIWLTEGWERNPCESWWAPGLAGDGEHAGAPADGWYWMDLPDRENLTRAILVLMVHPRARDTDVAGGLARHAARRARERGRTLVETVTFQGSAADAFWRAAGARPTQLEARRVLDVRKVTAGHFARIRDDAARAAEGYSLVTWTGVTPDDRLAGVAGILNAMNDAPHSEGSEDADWDADRVRERADSSHVRMGVRSYSVAAVHEATGEMAALTQVEVDPDSPQWGHQGLTAVTRPHRGHRLGLLVKAAMLDWLAGAEPEIERIETGNDSTNQHMIAVNESLGYEVFEPLWQWYEIEVAGLLREEAS